MEKEICGYIYRIRNTVNEKVYIGLTRSNFNKRYNANGEGIERVYNYHVREREREKYYNKHLLNSIEKYGFEAFEVIKEFDIAYSEEELKEKERYWINFYKCNDANYGYNRTEGGDGVCLKGEDNPKYKGFVAVYPNGQISEVMTEKKLSNYLNICVSIVTKLAREKTCYIGRCEHIRYVRILRLKDYLEEREIYKSDEDFRNRCKRMVEEAKILYKEKKEMERKRQSEAEKGREVSEETRKRQSESLKGKEKSEEHKKNLSEARKGKFGGIKNSFAKSVVAIFPDGRIIKDVCMKELAEELKTTRDTIRSRLNSHEPYKPRNKHLKHLEGIIIMSQEDYLKDYLNMIENQNQNINDDKAS